MKQFAWTTVIRNLVTIAVFFKAIYTDIFWYLLNAKSLKNDLLRLVSTDFGMIEIKS